MAVALASAQQQTLGDKAVQRPSTHLLRFPHSATAHHAQRQRPSQARHRETDRTRFSGRRRLSRSRGTRDSGGGQCRGPEGPHLVIWGQHGGQARVTGWHTAGSQRARARSGSLRLNGLSYLSGARWGQEAASLGSLLKVDTAGDRKGGKTATGMPGTGLCQRELGQRSCLWRRRSYAAAVGAHGRSGTEPGTQSH